MQSVSRMPFIVHVLLVILVAFVWVASSTAPNDVDLVLPVERSIGGKEWTSSGKVKYVVNKQEKKLSVKFEQPTFVLKKPQLEQLRKDWMSVRIPVVSTTGKVVEGQYLVTSVKGCALLQDPKEVFTVLTDKTGALIALQYDRPLLPACVDKDVPQELEIASKIIAVLPKETPALPAPRIDPETLTKNVDGTPKEQQQPQSFLQQYWYLILPSILAYTLLTAPQGPPEQATGQPSEDAAASGRMAAATAAVDAAAGTQVRRRKGNQG